MTLDELADVSTVVATKGLPDELRKMLTQQSGVFVDAARVHQVDVSAEPVPGVEGILRLVGSDAFHTTIPGRQRDLARRRDPGVEQGSTCHRRLPTAMGRLGVPAPPRAVPRVERPPVRESALPRASTAHDRGRWRKQWKLRG